MKNPFQPDGPQISTPAVAIVLQLLGLLIAALLSLHEIETILGSLPAAGLLGILNLWLGWRSGSRKLFLFGAAAPAIGLACLVTIVWFQWSPFDAGVPVASFLCAIQFPVLAQGIYALGGTLDEPLNVVRRFQFRMASLFGLMFAAAAGFALWRAGPRWFCAGLAMGYVMGIAYLIPGFRQPAPLTEQTRNENAPSSSTG